MGHFVAANRVVGFGRDSAGLQLPLVNVAHAIGADCFFLTHRNLLHLSQDHRAFTYSIG